MEKRLTKKTYNGYEYLNTAYELCQKLGQIEDLMEKYDILDLKELEYVLKNI